MDSGWAQFRVLYNFEPRDRRDIAIEVGDVMIVAKPVSDFCDWLTGHNTRTREVGEFPGTYVEYIGDITHFPSVENNPQPPVPPPRPPRTPSRLPDSGHSLFENSATKPVWCYKCGDFVWGNGSQVSRCKKCDLSWHPKCTTDLSDIPCIIRTRRDEDDNDDNDDYIDLVTDPEEWKVVDVLVWLAATNHYLYAEVFRENEITGQKLRELTDVSLNQMNITDSTHKQSLLLAIQELFTGKSESRKNDDFSGCQVSKSGTVGGHFFKEQNYVTLQWCDKCGKCLWGLHRQGMECSECRFQCHRMCMFDSVVVCPRVNRRRRRGSDAEVPIFGVELGDQFRPSDIPAPMVMMKCIQAVEKRGLNLLNIHGIIPPGSEKNSLRTALNQNAKYVNMDDEEWRNPHCASAVLKMYLNELPTCVFTEERYGSFVGPFKDASTESIDEMVTELVESLPAENKSMLMYLMEHLYKISKNVDWNDMSSHKLASLFAPLLLRPNRQDILKLVSNHETAVNIIERLMLSGDWTKRPPVPPRRKPRIPDTIGETSNDTTEKLQDCPWYWGQINKETVSERLKDQPDGTFIVRDSRAFPGEYTLTLRKGGLNKLIRILHKDGLYGFSEPLVFTSVVNLINHYKTRSLASYNAKLDVKLETPLDKYEQEDDDVGGNEGENQEELFLSRLEAANKMYIQKSDEYERIHNQYVQSEQEITDYHEELDAHREIVNMIDEQIALHEKTQNEAPPQHRAILRQNFEILKHKKQLANGMLMTLEREVANKMEETRSLNVYMNNMKPEIMKLQRTKQQYYLVLTTEKGMEVDRIKERIGEGGPSILSGVPNGISEEDPTYDSPDTFPNSPGVDLSESKWLRGRLAREEVRDLLQHKADGSFVIRESTNRAGEYALALKYNNCIKHIAIERGSNGCFGLAENHTPHHTLRELVNWYHSNSLHVHNPLLDITLKYPVEDAPNT